MSPWGLSSQVRRQVACTIHSTAPFNRSCCSKPETQHNCCLGTFEAFGGRALQQQSQYTRPDTAETLVLTQARSRIDHCSHATNKVNSFHTVLLLQHGWPIWFSCKKHLRDTMLRQQFWHLTDSLRSCASTLTPATVDLLQCGKPQTVQFYTVLSRTSGSGHQ